MRSTCLFLHHLAVGHRPHLAVSLSNWGRSIQTCTKRRPYSTNNVPKQPTAMSFSLPRVQRPSADSNPNGDVSHGNTMSNSMPSSYPMSTNSSENPSLSSVYDTMSKATIIGRTGALPEIKDLPSGIRLATIRLATNHLVGSGSSQRVETQWHTVQIYDGVTGFSIISSLPVGTQLYIEGALRISTYEKDGNTKQYINISVNKSLGLFRILRRPYRAGNDDSTKNDNTSSESFPF